MSQPRFQRAKKSIDTNEIHCENARERPTRNGTGTPYYIYRNKAQKPVCKRQNPYYNKMYRKCPRFDFSHALQAHNTNNKLIKTTC